MPRTAVDVPESLKKLLTVEELAEAESWLEREQRTTLLREELAARTLADTIAAANMWFAKQENLAEHEWVANNILPELQVLRKTIKRALG